MREVESAYDRVIEALHAAGCQVQQVRAGHAMAQCPAHDDRSPSLSVGALVDCVGLKCFAGCETEDVVGKLGLTMKDLFDQSKVNSSVVTRYVYTDAAGAIRYAVLREEPKGFSQQSWSGKAWRPTMKGVELVLYRLPAVLAAVAAGETVYVCEGEKDVHALESIGLVATCNAGGAGKWLPSYGDALAGANVVVVGDRDDAGREHVRVVLDDLLDKVASVAVVQPAVGKDAADHVTAGKAEADFVTVDWDSPRERTTWDLADLEQAEFPYRPWAIPGLVPAGLGMLSAPPKAGKSFLAQGLALAVATGTDALGVYPTRGGGDVLYLALEDGAERVRKRLRTLPAYSQVTRGTFTVRVAAPRLDDGGLKVIENWIVKHGARARLVVIDVFAAMRSEKDGRGKGNAYTEDYAALTGLRALANRYAVSILVIHHNKKGKATDPLEMMSGSTGLGGAVDYVAVLSRGRNEAHGVLYVVGRDIEDASLSLEFTGGQWSTSELPVTLVDATGNRAKAMRFLLDHGECSTGEVAEALNLSKDTARKILERLADDGHVEKTQVRAPGRPVKWQVFGGGVSPISGVSGVAEKGPLTSGNNTGQTPDNLTTLSGVNAPPAEHSLSQDTQDTEDKEATQDTQDSCCKGGSLLLKCKLCSLSPTYWRKGHPVYGVACE